MSLPSFTAAGVPATATLAPGGTDASSHQGPAAYPWGPRPEQPPHPHQQQQMMQSYFGGGGGVSASADPLAQPSHGSTLPGDVMTPSESSGSLAQYGIGLAAGGGGGVSSFLMAGPGSLCAVLPRYVRHPPIEAVVFGWGVSDDGQLGLAEGRGDVVAPKVVEALLGVQFSGRSFSRTPLVAGSRNTLAIDAAGQVWSFGWNDRGTLGHGHRSRETKPKRIAALKGIRVVQVAIGGWHCLALSDRGTMFAWGGNEYGQCGTGLAPGQRDVVEPLPVDLGLGPNQRVRQVAAGGMHSLALLEDGTVWQWGENWGDFSMHPVRTPRPVPGAVAVAAVACGAFHNLALTAGGRVLSWGMNDYGQLGNGSTTYATAPRPVLDMDGVVVADIAAGGWHSCALSSAGEVWVWGRGEYGRLGLGDRSGSSKLRPQKVRGLESHVVVQVAAGGSHTMALTSTARLFVWGRGAFGRLGLADPDRDSYHPVECPLPGGTERWRVAAIGAGGRHSIGLAIPVRDAATTGGAAAAAEDEAYAAAEAAAAAGELAAAAAAAGLMLPPQLLAALQQQQAGGSAAALTSAGVGGGAVSGAFGSVISAQLQQLQQIGLQLGLHGQQLGGLGLGLRRLGSGEEYDNLDGYSEPSLYDRDEQRGGATAGPSPVRTRRQTAATADGDGGSVTAEGSITAASSVAAIAAMAAAAGSGGGGTHRGGTSGGVPGTAVQGVPLPAPPPPPPDFRPLSHMQSSLTDWPSVDSSGVAVSGDSSSMAAPPPTPTEPPAAAMIAATASAPARPPSPPPLTRGSLYGASSGSLGGNSLAPPSPSPSLASGSAASSLAAAAAPPPPLLTLRPGSVSVPPPPPSPMATTIGDAPLGPVDSPRAAAAAAARPKSPLRPPPPASVALPPPPTSYSMRRSSSAIGPLSQLSQILPGPAAVAAAAVLDADSDLAQPRGLAAAAAAVAAAAAASASGPSSLHGSVGNGGGGGSRNGSVTGMARYRTVFGGGGEDEDEATQAAEAAEAAAEEVAGGSGAGEDELGGELLDGEQDDTDEDQVYDGTGVQHPRSPSLLSRPRSPPLPLSPRRHTSFNAHAAVSISAAAATATGGAGGGGGGATATGGGGGGGSISGGGAAVSGSPSGRSLLASYGSPRLPSTIPQQEQ